jgi:hypothetical protein
LRGYTKGKSLIVRKSIFSFDLPRPLDRAIDVISSTALLALVVVVAVVAVVVVLVMAVCEEEGGGATGPTGEGR